MVKKNCTLRFIANVVEEAEFSGNVKGHSSKTRNPSTEIHVRSRNIDLILEQAEKSPKKLTLHKDPKLINEDLEIQVYNWALPQREAELAGFTIDVIDQALSIDSEFRNGDLCKLHDWVYEFMKRRYLAICNRTRKSQITNAAMQDVKEDNCRRLMTPFKSRIDNR